MSTAELSEPYCEMVQAVPLTETAAVACRDVDYAHDGVPLRGYEAKPVGSAARPAVVVIHDWNGLRDYARARAQMFARLGYHAFALDMYGAGRTFEDDDYDGPAAESSRYYNDLWLQNGRVQAAYDLVAADPGVDSSRIAVVGYCFGGTVGLDFARTGAPIALTASFHGTLPARGADGVDRITGSLLIATGAEDPLVPDADIAAYQDELRTNAVLDWQVLTYSGAPHAFTVPWTPDYRGRADQRSWALLLDELVRVFARDAS